LAEVHLERDGSITKIDNCACRRLVASFSEFWWECVHPEAQEPSPATQVQVDRVEAAAAELVPGSQQEVRVAGTNLNRVATVSFGDGVTVESFKAEEGGGALVARIQIAEGASPGPRVLEFKDSTGGGGQFTDAITVGKPSTPAPGAAPGPDPTPSKPRRRGRSKKDDD
jgi:hypothetical protein